MTLDLDGDLAVFFGVGEFAQNATIDPLGVARVIPVIYDETPMADLGGELDIVSATQPHFLAKAADMAGVAQFTRVDVSGDPYQVTEIVPDGTGLARVFLQKN